MDITGSTTVYAIAADPIAHVKTPQRLNALLRERGVDGVMVPFHVSPDGLPALFAGLRGLRNLGGLVVTVPHKEQAAVLCDEITPAARLIGAVNAIRLRDGKLAGGNFDGWASWPACAPRAMSPPAAASTWPAWAARARPSPVPWPKPARPAWTCTTVPRTRPRFAARLSAAYPRWTSAWPTSRRRRLRDRRQRHFAGPVRHRSPALPLDALPAGAVVPTP